MQRRCCWEATGGFDETLSAGEDWEYWARVATRYPFLFHDDLLAAYRIHGEMTLKSLEHMYRGTIAARERILCMPAFDRASAGDRYEFYCGYGIMRTALGDLPEGRMLFKQARTLIPVKAKAHALLLLSYLGPSAFRRTIQGRRRLLGKVHGQPPEILPEYW
jgi:hypothetical protein